MSEERRIDNILEQAREEVIEGKTKAAKDQLKAKLKAIQNARQVVVNLERELEVLKEQIEADLDV